ncbi:MAG: diguanylate cyclase [Oscillospiraceae bacterium]
MYCNSPIAITQHFIRTHMEQRNLGEALACLTDNISWFGTGAFEIVHGKESAWRLLLEEISQFPPGYTIAFENMSETMLTEDCGTVFGNVLITDHTMGSQLECRLTTACVRSNGYFLISSLHMSLPTSLQTDSEFYPLTIAAQKIQQIKDSFLNTTIPGGLICCDAAAGFRLKYVNDFFVNLLGYQNKDEFLSVIGGLFVNCMSDADDITGMEHDVDAMGIDEHRTFTYRVKTKAGNDIWLREYTHKYESNGTFELLCFCMDISDIIHMESKLQAQKKQLEFANAEIQTIIENIPGGVHSCQLFDRIHVDYVSHGFEEMSGYTQAEIQTLFNNNYTKLLIEEDRSIFSTAIRKLAAEPANQSLNYRMCRKDGTIIRVNDNFRSVRMEDGKMWGFGVATDVTSQYETLAQLKLLTDSIPGGLAVYEYSSNGFETVYYNDGVWGMTGYSKDEYDKIIKTNLTAMYVDEEIDMLRDKFTQVMAGGNSIDCVYRLRAKNGNYLWINLRGTVADRWANVIRINAVLLDITASKQSEENLRIRDEEYSLAIKQSGKVVYRYTVANKSVYMLQKSVDMFDFPTNAENVPYSIISMNFIASESVNDFIGFYKAIHKGEKSGQVTLRRKLKSGGFGWCRSHFTTIFNSNDEPVSAIISIEDITKQHEQELENKILRQNEELFQIVVSHSDRFIIKYDIATRTAYLQKNSVNTFGFSQINHNVPYSCVEKEGMSKESAQTYIDFYEKLIAGQPTAKAFVKMKKNEQDNHWGWYRFDGSVIFDDTQRPIYAVVSFMEVTEQYEKELAYERMNKHINLLSKDAMLYFEANLTEMKIEHASGNNLSIVSSSLNLDPTSLLNKAVNEIVYPDDRDFIKHFFDRNSLFADFANGNTEKETEIRIIQNNQTKWVYVTIEMIADPYTENILVYILFRDIDKTKTKEISILKQAQTDGMTNLYNRTAIEQKIKHILNTKNNELCAFVIIDIDDLKNINDTLGHIQGDHSITAFANIIRSCFSEYDLIGRIGGDEFLAFLYDIGDKQNLIELMNTLVYKLSSLRVGENNHYPLHGSIGVSISSSDNNDFETLYKQADTALYFVKRHGKNNYALYSDDMISKDISPEDL